MADGKLCPLYSLDPNEARSLLEGFLETEACVSEQMLIAARREGLEVDFSVESLRSLMRWAVRQLKTIPQLPDPSLPTWITKIEDYQRDLFDFDEPSKVVVLRIAYYMGECFVRNFADLLWSIGDADTALKNIPVVSGSRGGLEMPPMLVAENLFRRMLKGDTDGNAIDVAFRRWVADVDHNAAPRRPN